MLRSICTLLLVFSSTVAISQTPSSQPSKSNIPKNDTAKGSNITASTSRVLNKLRAGEPLIIAYREASIPFSYVAGGADPIGYAIDLCVHLAGVMQRELKLKELPIQYLPVTSAQRIPTIVEGKADLQCSSTTNNAERRQQVAFTIPHFITGGRYLVKSDSKIKGIDDLRGKKVVSTVGTTVIKQIEQKNQELSLGITVLQGANHTQGVEMVENGEADAFVMDDILLYGLAVSRPDPKALKIVGKHLNTEPLAIMFGKDDPELKKLIDKEMRRLILSKEIYPIYDKWFTKPIPPKNYNLNLPPSFLLRDFWKYPSDFVPN